MKKETTYRMIVVALLSAIEVILSFTPAGYLQIGIFYLTTLHIPVIVAGIYFGWKEGAFLGFVFGMTSMIHAVVLPSMDSVFFSPAISGIPAMIIALVPRVALGIGSAFIGELLKRIKINVKVANIISCILSSVIHTVLVLALIYIFFRSEYNALAGVNYDSLITLIIAVLLSNGIAEAVLGAIIGAPLIQALDKIRKRG